MKHGRRLLAPLLALILLLALALPAAADYPARTEAMDLSEDWTGKTILLHTNDVHGAISGYAVAANMKLKLEKAGAEVLLIDAGDFLQGDAAVNMSEGASAVELMNAAGYDLAIPGNHEFDFGVPQLIEDVKAAQFPVICANVFRGEELLFPADWTYTGKSGMKIGFFGLDTPESQTKAAPKLTVGVLRPDQITPKLYEKFPSVAALAEASPDEIEEIVRPCGLGPSKARDISACMRMLHEKYGDNVPDTFEELLALPGVGRKSANLIMGDIFGKPAIVTDTHCIRLTNLIGMVDGIKEPAKVERELWKIVPPEEGNNLCHRFVLHGRAVCVARRPQCDVCCLKDICRHAQG